MWTRKGGPKAHTGPRSDFKIFFQCVDFGFVEFSFDVVVCISFIFFIFHLYLYFVFIFHDISCLQYVLSCTGPWATSPRGGAFDTRKEMKCCSLSVWRLKSPRANVSDVCKQNTISSRILLSFIFTCIQPIEEKRCNIFENTRKARAMSKVQFIMPAIIHWVTEGGVLN